MKILNKKEFEKLMCEYPEGGIVFAEYAPETLITPIMVTDGNFGAREVVGYQGVSFAVDWNIEELYETDLIAVFDNNDVLQMIQTLTSGLKIDLEIPY